MLNQLVGWFNSVDFNIELKVALTGIFHVQILQYLKLIGLLLVFLCIELRPVICNTRKRNSLLHPLHPRLLALLT